MPEATFDLMMGFLRQNHRRFSRRAREQEFAALTAEEAAGIEAAHQDMLGEALPPHSAGAEPPARSDA
jgi:hypothetical protein